MSPSLTPLTLRRHPHCSWVVWPGRAVPRDVWQQAAAADCRRAHRPPPSPPARDGPRRGIQNVWPSQCEFRECLR
jgi:hypothetical protein